MKLYNFPLATTGGITHAIYGNFSAPKAQEVVIARGSILEILRPDDETGRAVSIFQHDTFGVIRSLRPFRLTGS